MVKERFYMMGLSFLTLSIKYLYLAKNVSDENIKRGNPHMMSGDKEITAEEYEEMTKWSDFNTSSPVLFNFYHGLELLLKGFLLLTNDYIIKPSYHIEELFEEFKEKYSEEKKIISILEKYLKIDLMPDFLANCLKNNNIQIDNLYEFLRYPTDKNAQNIYDYIDLKYKEEKGLIFFKGLAGDLDVLGREMVKLYREIEKQQGDNLNKNKI